MLAGMRLVTARLVLREFAKDELLALHAFESDPEAARYQSYGPRTADGCRDLIRQALADPTEHPRRVYDLAVVRRAEGDLVGRCGLKIVDTALREGMLWYILHRAHWGQGYIPEATRALLDFGFAELGLHRVWADCDPANAASIRVLEKLGLGCEAHFRENARIKGAWVDSLIYAVLDREWPTAAPPIERQANGSSVAP
jgi:[ribosomal protein S5]-alanine N-acetyltransferase